MFNRNNILLLHKCATDRLIYPICLYIKNTPDISTVSLPPLMSPTNDGDTNNRKFFTDSI